MEDQDDETLQHFASQEAENEEKETAFTSNSKGSEKRRGVRVRKPSGDQDTGFGAHSDKNHCKIVSGEEKEVHDFILLKDLKSMLKRKPKCDFKKMVDHIPSSTPTESKMARKKAGSDASESKCPFCGKGFPSVNSLYGHMRCHPERKQRGVHTPSKNTSSSCSYSEKKRKEEMLESSSSFVLPSWSGKSSRRSNKGLVTAHDSRDIEAAKTLLMLAAEDLERKKPRRGEDLKDYSKPPKKQKIGFDQESERVVQEDCGRRSYSDYDSLCLESKRKKKTLLSKAGDIEERVEKVVEYKCSNCNKCFPTHQALGGHRSSHKNLNGSPPALAIEDEEEEEEEKKKEEEQGEAVLNSEEQGEVVLNSGSDCSGSKQEKHTCIICNRSFSTGQAVGGHMRCHRNGSRDKEAPIPPATTTNTSTVTSNEEEEAASKVVHDFDLNVPAVMEEEKAAGGILDLEQPIDQDPNSHSAYS